MASSSASTGYDVLDPFREDESNTTYLYPKHYNSQQDSAFIKDRGFETTHLVFSTNVEKGKGAYFQQFSSLRLKTITMHGEYAGSYFNCWDEWMAFLESQRHLETLIITEPAEVATDDERQKIKQLAALLKRKKGLRNLSIAGANKESPIFNALFDWYDDDLTSPHVLPDLCHIKFSASQHSAVSRIVEYIKAKSSITNVILDIPSFDNIAAWQLMDVLNSDDNHVKKLSIMVRSHSKHHASQLHVLGQKLCGLERRLDVFELTDLSYPDADFVFHSFLSKVIAPDLNVSRMVLTFRGVRYSYRREMLIQELLLKLPKDVSVTVNTPKMTPTENEQWESQQVAKGRSYLDNSYYPCHAPRRSNVSNSLYDYYRSFDYGDDD